MLIKYIKEDVVLDNRTIRNARVACMVAFLVESNQKIAIGVSGWNPILDDYDPIIAKEIAFDRALVWKDRWQDRVHRKPAIPKSLPLYELYKFVQRALAYYKNASLVQWAQVFKNDIEKQEVERRAPDTMSVYARRKAARDAAREAARLQQETF
jgi:hypothetical protein